MLVIGRTASVGVALLSVALLWSPARSAAAAPESARSRAAVAAHTPRLEDAVRGMDLTWGAPVFIRIFKRPAVLEVWLDDGTRFRLFRGYPICAYSGRLGPKVKTGDGQAPEGFYFVAPRQLNPAGRFHLSFNLGYPNAYDRAHGRTGKYLMVHGNCVSIGCYAMTDPAIEEIWTLMDATFRHGQPFVRLHAFPFRLTAANMAAHREGRWAGFWAELKDGYDRFERDRRPPEVGVRNGRYVFGSGGER